MPWRAVAVSIRNCRRTPSGGVTSSNAGAQARTGWPTPQLQAALLELELAGQVGRLPGGLFQRLGAA